MSSCRASCSQCSIVYFAPYALLTHAAHAHARADTPDSKSCTRAGRADSRARSQIKCADSVIVYTARTSANTRLFGGAHIHTKYYYCHYARRRAAAAATTSPPQLACARTRLKLLHNSIANRARSRSVLNFSTHTHKRACVQRAAHSLGMCAYTHACAMTNL